MPSPGQTRCLRCLSFTFSTMGAASQDECTATCTDDPAFSPCSPYASCTNITALPGFNCTCNACYTGTGRILPGGGCRLTAFPGFDVDGRRVVISDDPNTQQREVNAARTGEPIRFKFSFGCDTGPGIFADTTRMIVNVSCNTPGERRQLIFQELAQGPGLGAWTYNDRT
jgi:hypothetical protein